MTKEMITANECPIIFDYASDETIAAIEQLPRESLADLESASRAIAGDLGIDCEVAVTHETIEDFENSRTFHWVLMGTDISDDCTKNSRAWKNIQTRKGETRGSMAVVDCGDLRAVLTA